jgi:hypothetical protein
MTASFSQGGQNSKEKEFRSSGVQEFRSSGVQEFRSSGVQEFRSSAWSGTRDCKPKRLAQDTAFIERVLTAASSNSCNSLNS